MAQVGKQFKAIEIDDAMVSKLTRDYPTTKHVSAPASAPTLAKTTGGSLAAGTYYVSYTWVDPDGQTNESPEANITVSLNDKITATVAAFPTGVTKAKVYAGTTSGDLKLQGEVTTSGGSLEITSLDTTSEAPPSLEYDTGIDVPVIVEIALDPQFRTANLECDATVVDVFSKVTHINFQLRCRSMPLDVLAMWAGGSVTQTPESSGGAGDSDATWTVLATDTAIFFKLQGRWINAKGIDSTDGQVAHVVLFKCKANQVSYRLNGDWAEVQVSGVAVRTANDRKILEVVFHEADQALS